MFEHANRASSQMSHEFIMKVLSLLELRLETSIFKESDMLVLAYLDKIIKDKIKYLDVDRRPDFWYLRQG